MELEQIEGTVEDIIYENPDNGYTVFEISGGGTVTVVCGIVGELHAGESVVCRGKYENHATYGRQFHAQECETDMPKDLEAVYAFLASGSAGERSKHRCYAGPGGRWVLGGRSCCGAGGADTGGVALFVGSDRSGCVRLLWADQVGVPSER